MDSTTGFITIFHHQLGACFFFIFSNHLKQPFNKPQLGSFNLVLIFIPILGESIQFDQYFSIGLKPLSCQPALHVLSETKGAMQSIPVFCTMQVLSAWLSKSIVTSCPCSFEQIRSNSNSTSRFVAKHFTFSYVKIMRCFSFKYFMGFLPPCFPGGDTFFYLIWHVFWRICFINGWPVFRVLKMTPSFEGQGNKKMGHVCLPTTNI